MPRGLCNGSQNPGSQGILGPCYPVNFLTTIRSHVAKLKACLAEGHLFHHLTPRYSHIDIYENQQRAEYGEDTYDKSSYLQI